MKWFLLALVMYTNKPSPDIKIHGGLTFTSNENCNNYLEKYKSNLELQLVKNFSHESISSISIKCINEENALKLYNKIKELQ